MTKIPDDVKEGIARIIDPGAWDAYAEEGSQLIAAQRQIVARSKVDKVLAFIVAAGSSGDDGSERAIRRDQREKDAVIAESLKHNAVWVDIAVAAGVSRERAMQIIIADAIRRGRIA